MKAIAVERPLAGRRSGLIALVAVVSILMLGPTQAEAGTYKVNECNYITGHLGYPDASFYATNNGNSVQDQDVAHLGVPSNRQPKRVSERTGRSRGARIGTTPPPSTSLSERVYAPAPAPAGVHSRELFDFER